MEKQPTSIADFEFVRSLGPTAHGESFLARKPPRLPVEAEFVVVNVLGDASAPAVARASNYLKAYGAVKSPYIATVYEAGEQLGVFYYASEYVPGGSLYEPYIQPRLPGAVANVAVAAQSLHDVGIVHREIRPANVLLTDSGAKLGNPGLSHIITPGVIVPRQHPARPLDYTDPAILNGEDPSPASDVWALGATVHWVATQTGFYGDLPEDDPLLSLRRVLRSSPQLAQGLSPDLAGLVASCLGDILSRPTAGDLAQQLMRIA